MGYSGAEEDRSSYRYTIVPRAQEVGAYLAAQFERAEQRLIPFAQIRLADNHAVGCTAFWDTRYLPGHFPRGSRGLRAIEIGFTWLARSAQGSGINAEAKLLLLRYSFENLRVARVDLKTDARNERSRRAMDALGLTFEGVSRSWSMSWAPGEDGLLRDSVMYSVTASEWAAVQDRISRRLGRAIGADR
jgi:RimJ/RimL family protein N-acetyltransferase